jgi:hypothetical protein
MYWYEVFGNLDYSMCCVRARNEYEARIIAAKLCPPDPNNHFLMAIAINWDSIARYGIATKSD